MTDDTLPSDAHLCAAREAAAYVLLAATIGAPARDAPELLVLAGLIWPHPRLDYGVVAALGAPALWQHAQRRFDDAAGAQARALAGLPPFPVNPSTPGG